jgi:hypothetical protein
MKVAYRILEIETGDVLSENEENNALVFNRPKLSWLKVVEFTTLEEAEKCIEKGFKEKNCFNPSRSYEIVKIYIAK